MKGIVLATALFVAAVLLFGCNSDDDRADEQQSDTEQAKALPAGANQMCPVMPEEEVDPSLYVEYEGKKIYVCCQKCVKRVEEDPAVWYAKAYGD